MNSLMFSLRVSHVLQAKKRKVKRNKHRYLEICLVRKKGYRSLEMKGLAVCIFVTSSCGEKATRDLLKYVW